MDNMQPGQVIIPHASDEQPVQPVQPGGPQPARPLEGTEPDPGPAPTPAPTPEPETFTPEQTVPYETAAEPVNWQSQQEPEAMSLPSQAPADISWTASEFIAHEKSIIWYGAVIAVGLVAASLDYLAFKDIFSTAIIMLAVITFAIYAARKPRAQQYMLTHQGVQIGSRMYAFQDFRNFSIAQEGAIASIVFMPLKRFMPALTVYVAPEMEDQVVDYLSAILPFEMHKSDALETLMRRIRF